MSKLGRNLAAAREAKGWSQTELARRTGFKPSAISHFELGRREPSVTNLCRLLRVLGVSADSVLGLNVKSDPNLIQVCKVLGGAVDHLATVTHQIPTYVGLLDMACEAIAKAEAL